jgi:hypothetical protein
MDRKQLPQPPPWRGGRQALTHDTTHAGRSYHAVARLAIQSQSALAARTAAKPGRGQRAPPIPLMDRADGWLHRP